MICPLLHTQCIRASFWSTTVKVNCRGRCPGSSKTKHTLTFLAVQAWHLPLVFFTLGVPSSLEVFFFDFFFLVEPSGVDGVAPFAEAGLTESLSLIGCTIRRRSAPYLTSIAKDSRCKSGDWFEKMSNCSVDSVAGSMPASLSFLLASSRRRAVSVGDKFRIGSC